MGERRRIIRAQRSYPESGPFLKSDLFPKLFLLTNALMASRKIQKKQSAKERAAKSFLQSFKSAKKLSFDVSGIQTKAAAKDSPAAVREPRERKES